MFRSVRVWLGIVVSALFLYLAGTRVDLAKTQEALRSADYGYLPFAVLLTFLTNWLRAYRWKWMLNPIRNVAVLRLFSGVAIGYMTNNLLPARLGEIARAYIVGKREGISRSSTLATIVVERIFDGVTLLFFLGSMSFAFSFPLWVQRVGMISGVFFFSVLGGLYLVMMKKSLRTWVNGWVLWWVPVSIADRVQKLAGSFLAGLVVLRRRRDIVLIFFCSVMIWLVEAFTYYIVALAFALEIPFYVAVLAVVIVNLGSLIPAGPGSIGTFEFFCMYVLTLFAIQSDVALSFAIVIHAVVFLPITIVGIFCFWRENLGWSEIRVGTLTREA
jgi:glycosyltransferase 2 family protein